MMVAYNESLPVSQAARQFMELLGAKENEKKGQL